MEHSELEFARECIEECKNLYMDNCYEEAVLLALRAKEIFEEEKAYADICHAINLLGIIYSTFGDENMSADYYLNGIDIAKEHKLGDELSLFYNNLGSEYLDLKDYEHARKLFLDAYEIVRNFKVLPDHEFILYVNLCNTYYELEKYEEASRFLELARGLTSELEDFDKLSFAVTECCLENRLGHTDRAGELAPGIMELVMKCGEGAGYWQDIAEFALALVELNRRDDVYHLLQWVDEDVGSHYGNEVDTQLEIKIVELKLQIFKAFGDEENYRKHCVLMQELRMAGREYENRRRASNMSIRIELHNKEEEWKKEEKKSNYDALTAVRNRYRLKEDGQRAIGEAIAKGQAFTVGILDLDYFKQVNDSYGHIRGDKYLQAVVEAVKESLPADGHIYRYGGDEFVLLLKTDSQEVVEAFALQAQENLRLKKLENKASEVSDYLTISQGYMILTPKKEDLIWNLIELADTVLYKVKQAGKNSYRVEKRLE